MALGAQARRRLPWQQPRKAAIDRREVSNDKEMRRAVNDYKAGRLFEIVVIDRIAATKTYNLGDLRGPITISCAGEGRITAAQTDFPLFTVEASSSWSELRFERMVISDFLRYPLSEEYGSLTEALTESAPGTFLRIQSGSCRLVIVDSSIITTDGATAAGGTLLDTVGATAQLDASVFSGDNVVNANLSSKVENSRFIGVDFLGNDLTLENGSDQVQVIGCTRVGDLTLANATTDAIVANCIGSGALAATSGNGNTIIGNRGFSAYPTAGSGDVVADNV